MQFAKRQGADFPPWPHDPARRCYSRWRALWNSGGIGHAELGCVFKQRGLSGGSGTDGANVVRTFGATRRQCGATMAATAASAAGGAIDNAAGSMTISKSAIISNLALGGDGGAGGRGGFGLACCRSRWGWERAIWPRRHRRCLAAPEGLGRRMCGGVFNNAEQTGPITATTFFPANRAISE